MNDKSELIETAVREAEGVMDLLDVMFYMIIVLFLTVIGLGSWMVYLLVT